MEAAEVEGASSFSVPYSVLAVTDGDRLRHRREDRDTGHAREEDPVEVLEEDRVVSEEAAAEAASEEATAEALAAEAAEAEALVDTDKLLAEEAFYASSVLYPCKLIMRQNILLRAPNGAA